MNTQPLSHAEANSETPPPQTSPTVDSPSVFGLPLAELRMRDPIRWIQLGWADFVRCPRIGLF
ncbi:MAG: hypothetical protein RI914_1697, partial [Pseudomonadota bacterium]